MNPLDRHVKNQLNQYLANIEKYLGEHVQCGVDAMSIIGPIMPGIDVVIRNALEMQKSKSSTLAIILETGGGDINVVERMVGIIRSFYDEVIVLVPEDAMSAGTVLALSADRIMMDYFSRLGPIDPQIVRDDKLVPALSYLHQYERLNEKAMAGDLTTVEYMMLQQLDVGELYQFEQARELSVDLLQHWLPQYKFKTWKVDQSIKQKRANEIARILNDPARWRSHGRGIDITTLRDELKLQIDDYSKIEGGQLKSGLRKYFGLLTTYLQNEELVSFVHTKEFFDFFDEE